MLGTRRYLGGGPPGNLSRLNARSAAEHRPLGSAADFLRRWLVMPVCGSLGLPESLFLSGLRCHVCANTYTLGRDGALRER